MAEKISKKEKFKRFLKRDMTPTWAKHFSYQVFAFVVSVALVIGVASYAFDKSFDERRLRFVDGFQLQLILALLKLSIIQLNMSKHALITELRLLRSMLEHDLTEQLLFHTSLLQQIPQP